MTIREKLSVGNKQYLKTSDAALRLDTAENGQHPYAIVVCCSDSRVIPEQIFSADIGDLFVIRVAGNVLDQHQLGSIEYAAGHLHCQHIIVLGHTCCGAVTAALQGGGDGFIKYITDDILEAIGSERDPDKACCLNVKHSIAIIENSLLIHQEEEQGLKVIGGIYHLESGKVEIIC